MTNFKYYVGSWIAMLAAFNAIVFVCADGNFSSAFWIGYVFITVAFVGQLFCAYTAFKPENLTKKFYNLPIVTESYVGLILMLAFGSLFMATPELPKWPGTVICVSIFALTIITVMQASATSDMVEALDVKVAEDTAFVKNLTKEAEMLVSQAKTEEIKVECMKVYEVLRYSPKRVELDRQIELRIKFDDFKKAVDKDDIDLVQSLSKSF